MSSSQAAEPKSPGRQSWVDWLSSRRIESAYVCAVLAGILVLAAIVIGYRYRLDQLPLVLWLGLSGLVLGVVAFWRVVSEPVHLGERDFTRLQVLVLGGTIGLLTVIFLGFGSAYAWWETISGGWQAWQGKEGWRLWVVLLAIISGLAVMFVSLQLGRSDENSTALFRRVVFGYNSILTAWLLLLILVLVNALAYVPWGPLRWLDTTYYWAKYSMQALSPRSEKILESLSKPIKVYVIMSRRDQWYSDTRVLLDNCREVSRNLQVEYLSPDLDRERIEKLAQEFKFTDRQGILLVYGSGPEAQNRFIKSDELRDTSDIMAARRGGGSFKGERVLINELYGFTEEKGKPIVYFTQGNGELDLADSAATRQFGKGLGQLKRRMESSYYQVKGLRLSAVEGAKSNNPDVVVSTKVPDDAAIVVIAGPKQALPEASLNAIREYANPLQPGKAKGKLIVCLDVVLTPQKNMVQTGLEPTLLDLGVVVGNDEILTPSNPPELVEVILNPDEMVQSRNPIAAAFSSQRGVVPAFRFWRTRTVTAAKDKKPEAGRYDLDVLMVVPAEILCWAETNLQTNYISLINDYLRKNVLRNMLSTEPLSVAMAVAEGPPRNPMNPHAALEGAQKPRMVVVGNAAWLGNSFMAETTGGVYYDIFTSMLSWLRERPNNIGIEAKRRETYTMSTEANTSRILFTPTILMLVGIIGLGAGVWVVRRR